MLNAGSNARVQTGMGFDLVERGQVSGGGIEFGKEENVIGQARAMDVHEGYTLLGVSGPPAKVGTIVKIRADEATE